MFGFKDFMLETHRKLGETRAVLWSLAMETDSAKEQNTLFDAMELVTDEMIKIELSEEWEQYIAGGVKE